MSHSSFMSEEEKVGQVVGLSVALVPFQVSRVSVLKVRFQKVFLVLLSLSVSCVAAVFISRMRARYVGWSKKSGSRPSFTAAW